MTANRQVIVALTEEEAEALSGGCSHTEECDDRQRPMMDRCYCDVHERSRKAENAGGTKLRAALDTDPEALVEQAARAIKAEQNTLSGPWGASPTQLARAVLSAITSEGGGPE